MIPGSNLLNLALTVIAKQTITYYRALGRSLNNVGQDITVYEEPVMIVGSFQPVPRRLYEQFGLDLQKTYYTFYTSNNLIDVGRNVSGDQIVFGMQRFQCESSNDWFAIDGWVGMLCVLIYDQDQSIFGFNETPSINNYLNFDNSNYPPDGGA